MRGAALVRANFDALSGEWDRYYKEGHPLFASREVRFMRMVKRYAPGVGRALDYGCGTGRLAQALAVEGWQVTGADVSSGMLEVARLEYPQARWCEVEEGAVLPFAGGEFEVVVASSVLEYVGALDVLLGELGRVAKEGAVMVMTVPDMRHWRRWGEVVLKPWVEWGLVREIAGWMGKKAYAECLYASCNRFGVDGWRERLERSGWSMEEVERGDPLVLVVARKCAG